MQDEEIEKAMLYYLIFENYECELIDADFTTRLNKKIFKAIQNLKQAKEEITMLTVKNKLTDEKNILSYLATLSENIYSTTAESVYKKLIELTKKRQMQKLLNESATKIKDAENIDIDIEKVIKELNKIEDREIKEESLKEQIIDTLEMIEKNMKNKNDYSLYTGMLDLDQLTCGLHNEELTIIGARPGMGKTTFALQIADYIAKKKIPVMFISLEMSEEQIITKLIAKDTRINSTKMRLGTLTDQEAVKVYEAGAELEEKSLYITSNLRTIQQIEVEARKLKNKKNIGLIIIDYIQLIKSSQKFNLREQEVADITRTLKLLTLELKIPIIGLCQLNRNATRQEPMLSDLRESGAIEQDADNVIFIYQEEETDAAAPVVTIKLAKQRAGTTGKVNMVFRKVYSEFVNIIRR
jgi:dnaB-like helicase N terminal domain|uniref:DNA 5'-3' helicase n=1 Tax=Myoviridae sp. ct8mY9 TaxID=2827664 RepID=A0A8S5SEH8_9CAUD|nr:MAG TPA: DnaB-like replicative helicase [Myoviridae sp. ct8mY9]